MASVKAVLRQKKNSKGLYPVSIRITKDRKSSFISLGQYIDEKFWDVKNNKVKKSHPNASRINQLILTRLKEANDRLLESEASETYESISTIKKKITSKNKDDFFIVAKRYLDNLLKAEKYRSQSRCGSCAKNGMREDVS